MLKLITAGLQPQNCSFQQLCIEGMLSPNLLWSHLKIHISLNIYDTLIYDIQQNRGLSHLFTDVRHINRHIFILERTGHQK